MSIRATISILVENSEHDDDGDWRESHAIQCRSAHAFGIAIADTLTTAFQHFLTGEQFDALRVALECLRDKTFDDKDSSGLFREMLHEFATDDDAWRRSVVCPYQAAHCEAEKRKVAGDAAAADSGVA